MSRRNRSGKKANNHIDNEKPNANAWVLTTKCVGDHIAGWTVEELFKQNIRNLDSSERCSVTSYCYPPGAKLIQAKLMRA
jgi:hypothetical protein